MQIQVFFIFIRSYFSLNFFVAVKNEMIKMHSTCYGIMEAMEILYLIW
jgi:hypothetical protein